MPINPSNQFRLNMTSNEVQVEVAEYMVGAFARPQYEELFPLNNEGLFLPPGVRWYDPTHQTLLLEEPPRWRTLHFTPHNKGYGNEPTIYRVPMPFLVYGISLVPDAIRVVSVHWNTQPLGALHDRLVPAPLPNIYTASGQVCPAHYNATDSIAHPALYTQVSHALDNFWASEFNLDIEDFTIHPFAVNLVGESLSSTGMYNSYFCAWEGLSVSEMLLSTQSPGQWYTHSHIASPMPLHQVIDNLKQYTDTSTPLSNARGYAKLLQELVTRPREVLPNQVIS